MLAICPIRLKKRRVTRFAGGTLPLIFYKIPTLETVVGTIDTLSIAKNLDSKEKEYRIKLKT